MYPLESTKREAALSRNSVSASAITSFASFIRLVVATPRLNDWQNNEGSSIAFVNLLLQSDLDRHRDFAGLLMPHKEYSNTSEQSATDLPLQTLTDVQQGSAMPEAILWQAWPRRSPVQSLPSKKLSNLSASDSSYTKSASSGSMSHTPPSTGIG